MKKTSSSSPKSGKKTRTAAKKTTGTTTKKSKAVTSANKGKRTTAKAPAKTKAKKVAAMSRGQLVVSQEAPEALELTKTQANELKFRLEGLKEEIRAQLAGIAENFNASSQNESLIKGDDAEVAEKQRQSNAALQEMDMLKNRLILVERALKKMEQGLYGICEETDEPIGYERLCVIPWARYGVKVQEMRERRLRDYKGGRLAV